MQGAAWAAAAMVRMQTVTIKHANVFIVGSPVLCRVKRKVQGYHTDTLVAPDQCHWRASGDSTPQQSNRKRVVIN
jgi:hypothetical protein